MILIIPNGLLKIEQKKKYYYYYYFAAHKFFQLVLLEDFSQESERQWDSSDHQDSSKYPIRY